MEKSYYNNTQIRLQNYMKNLRKNINEESIYDSKVVLKVEDRFYYENNKAKKRKVIFLKGAGCSKVELVGGCTFCGFYNATNRGEKISKEFYTKELVNVFNNLEEEIEKVCLYNDGSLLSEKEIEFDIILEIFNLIREYSHINSVTIEAKIEDICEEKIAKIRESYKGELEIAVGFESANKIVRDLCINKSFENDTFLKVVSISKKYDVHIIPLLMIKPPFLTEKEAAIDFIESLIFLENHRLKRIDIELPTVEKDTLTYKLWKKGLYKPLNFWTLVEILKMKKKLKIKTPIYISPMNYSVTSIAETSSCKNCNLLFTQNLLCYQQSIHHTTYRGGR